MSDTGVLRTFDTGATRDTEGGKLDFEGFFSPAVVEEYARYMHLHRVQSDGNIRDSDNWQKGMGLPVYIKSLWRHFFTMWKIHRGGKVIDNRDGHDVLVMEAACGILFNTMGYMHELLAKPAEISDGVHLGCDIKAGDTTYRVRVFVAECPWCGEAITGFDYTEDYRETLGPGGTIVRKATGTKEGRAMPCGHTLAYGKHFTAEAINDGEVTGGDSPCACRTEKVQEAKKVGQGNSAGAAQAPQHP